jgi:hypothetical protein
MVQGRLWARPSTQANSGWRGPNGGQNAGRSLLLGQQLSMGSNLISFWQNGMFDGILCWLWELLLWPGNHLFPFAK